MDNLSIRQQEAYDHGYDYGRFNGYVPDKTNLKNYFGKNYIYGIKGAEQGLIDRNEILLTALLEGTLNNGIRPYKIME